MEKIGNSTPFVWLNFDKVGNLTDANALSKLASELGPNKDVNLFIVSHGWKTDQASAWKGYEDLWKPLETLLAPAGEKWLVAGVSWPSKQYDKSIDSASDIQATGGALGIGASTKAFDLTEAEVIAQVLEFATLAGEDPAELIGAAKSLLSDGMTVQNCASFLTAVDQLIAYTDPGDDELTASVKPFLTPNPIKPFQALLYPPLFADASNRGKALGVETATGGAKSGIGSAIGRLLNQFTFFTMKKRAGTVGAAMAKSVLGTAIANAKAIHLCGHSFGGRLVAAAASSLTGTQRVESLILMQAAFSHYGLTPGFKPGKNGAFSAAITDKRAKRTLITHTHNDKALTLAYPLASRLSGDVASGLGDASDDFGAMGANGAQRLSSWGHTTITAATPADISLPAGEQWLVSGKFDFIGDHNDVWGAEVASLVRQCVL